MGDGAHGISQPTLQRISSEIVEVVRMGREVGLVIGGGNFLRGANNALTAVDRVAGDQMGMLATVMNAVAVAAQLRALGTEAVVLVAHPTCGDLRPPSPTAARAQHMAEVGRPVRRGQPAILLQRRTPAAGACDRGRDGLRTPS